MALYKGSEIVAGLSKNTIVTGFNVFDCKWSDHLINDIQWLRADTFSWQSGDVYTTAYNTLVEEYSTGIEEVEANLKKQNFTVVGSVNISNGIASNFSTTNYLTLPNAFTQTSNAWEVNLKITTGSTVTGESYSKCIFTGGYSSSARQIYFVKNSSGKFALSLGDGGSSWNIADSQAGSLVVSPNTTYYLKVYYTGTAYKVDYSIDGINFVNDITINSSTPIGSYTPYIGMYVGSSNDYSFNGSIDLKYTNIYTNNSLYWSAYNSVVFKRSSNGFKIANSTQEDAILNKYNSDGIAWYYILDTTNKRFKLPRTKWGFKGFRGEVAVDINESLPNIKGEVQGMRWQDSNSASGAFALNTNYGATGFVSGSNGNRAFNFNASRSSSTYQDGAPVQERGTQMYLYFYVGEYAQTAIEQTAGLNAELFNGKADVNTPSIQATYLKTIFVDGLSGYRIWSDGYCEQWGNVVVNGTSTISLLKKFDTTKTGDTYTIECCLVDVWQSHFFKNLKSSNFQIVTGGNTRVLWKASGYLEEGEY